MVGAARRPALVVDVGIANVADRRLGVPKDMAVRSLKP
jgi:hypothetical protein